MNEFTEFLKSRQKCNLAMVAVNIIVFIVLGIIGNTESAEFMARHGAVYAPYVMEGQYWRLFTSMFLHFGFEHLAYNMVSLLFLGDVLEQAAGWARYLFIYFGGGLCGGLLSLGMELKTGYYAVSAGASGAIFAVIGAIFYIALRNRKTFGQSNMRRLVLMIVLMIMQCVVDKGVDNYAHLGGLIGGFLLAVLVWHPKKRQVVHLP